MEVFWNNIPPSKNNFRAWVQKERELPTRVTRGSFVNPIEKIPSDIEIGDGKPVWKNEAGGDMHLYPPRRSSWGRHGSWDNLQNRELPTRVTRGSFVNPIERIPSDIEIERRKPSGELGSLLYALFLLDGLAGEGTEAGTTYKIENFQQESLVAVLMRLVVICTFILLDGLAGEGTEAGTTYKIENFQQGIEIPNIQDYALWELIENGDSWVSVSQTTKENGITVTKMSTPVIVEEKTKKKNDVKARGLLLMALPNEHQLTFNQYPDAKSMFAAIETRFGGATHDHTQRLDALPPNLFEGYDRDLRELYTSAIWRLLLALEAWASQTDAREQLCGMIYMIFRARTMI
ncbi:hypothetical protein Tco_1221504 [Tanacetum coccineum]